MEQLHKASNLVITYDPEAKIMYCNWIGLQDEDALRKSGEIIYTLFKQKGCSKILNDNTHVIGPWYHSVDWTSGEWFPRMIKAGLKHFAWIFPTNIFAELSLKRALPSNKVVRTFNTYKEALDWLLSKE